MLRFRQSIVNNMENHITPRITSSRQSPTSHGMQQQRQPAPPLLKPEAPRLESLMSGSRSARRSRHFVPFCRKDECYWVKRRKNNEAARKSRDKRKANDVILSQKVLLLLQENYQLRQDLLAVKLKYNEVDLEEVSEFHKKVKDGNQILGGIPGISLANYGVPDSVIKALCNGMEVNLSAPSDQLLSCSELRSPCPISMEQQEYLHPFTSQHAQEELQSASTSAFIPLPNGSQTEVTKSPILYPQWLEANGIDTNELQFKKRSLPEKEPDGKNEWDSDSTCVIKREVEFHQCPLGPISSQCSVPSSSTSFSSSSSASSSNSAPIITSSAIADAQMLQNFVHTSWRKASEQSKSSTSSSDEAQKDGSCSCPISDYSSFSDTNSSNSHTSSPKGSLNNEECYEWSSTDDKGHRLPYKLRFKLSGLVNLTK